MKVGHPPPHRYFSVSTLTELTPFSGEWGLSQRGGPFQFSLFIFFLVLPVNIWESVTCFVGCIEGATPFCLQKSRMLLGIGIFGHFWSAGFWTCVLDWTGLSALCQQKWNNLWFGLVYKECNFWVHFFLVFWTLQYKSSQQFQLSRRLQNDPEKCPQNFQSFLHNYFYYPTQIIDGHTPKIMFSPKEKIKTCQMLHIVKESIISASSGPISSFFFFFGS